MNISSGDLIAGFPAIDVRNLFRKIDDASIGIDGAASHLKLGHRKAKEVLLQLESEDYLKSHIAPDCKGKKKTWWKLTTKGQGLRMASAAPPIKRATADRLLTDIIERAKEINISPKFLYKVTEIIVFGSYLDESRTTLGDLDLAINIEAKISDYKKLLKLNLAQADEEGQGYRGYFYCMSYGYFKTRKYLRNKSKGISLHTTDDGILKTGIPTKIVFAYEE